MAAAMPADPRERYWANRSNVWNERPASTQQGLPPIDQGPVPDVMRDGYKGLSVARLRRARETYAREQLQPWQTGYRARPEAAGMGYGSNHRHYYKYLSHWQAEQLDVRSDAPEPRAIMGYRSKGDRGYTPAAAGLGYGVTHRDHPRYVSVKRVDDLPPPVRGPSKSQPE
eukprot:CAMPEP_0205826550 /NCGR_PEP_ID=MMETSP0206-20130828/29025_1 /ASSEMBLY_ACC=CAM_ASM_000279 /TAXON_ID=36767 /ORGANISM="Euplotes focardii, Strain TN1" /LENGTH=169 /DNA_ID=CAMNT_0053126557 /DNA_START=59 /DNA_END=568 /DNA_ORIENTATION=+